MLTIREPIQLHIGRGMSMTGGEAFGRRISANYELMQARMSPKELLFLLGSEQEPPEPGGGATSLSFHSAVENNQNLSLEVVNHVVNRVLLMQRGDFTYQDSVYLTTALQKLGVTDVHQFFRQVSELSEENSSVIRLLRLYREHSGLIQTLRTQAEPPAAAPEAAGGAPPLAAPHHTSLYEEIYSRLGIARIYQMVHAYHSSLTAGFQSIHKNELLLAEQLRVSQALSLSETKNRIFQGGAAVLQHHVNRYELGDLLPPPETREQVLEQGAAAALLSVIDNSLLTALSRTLRKGDTWLDLRSALRASVENAVLRFEAYHSAYYPRESDSETYASRMSALYRQELMTFERLLERQTAYERLAAAARSGERPGEGLPAGERATLEHRRLDLREHTLLPEGEEASRPSPGEALRELTRLRQEQTLLERGPAPSGGYPPPQEGSAADGGQVTLEHRSRAQTEHVQRLEGEAEARPPAPEAVREMNRLTERLLRGEGQPAVRRRPEPLPVERELPSPDVAPEAAEVRGAAVQYVQLLENLSSTQQVLARIQQENIRALTQEQRQLFRQSLVSALTLEGGQYTAQYGGETAVYEDNLYVSGSPSQRIHPQPGDPASGEPEHSETVPREARGDERTLTERLSEINRRNRELVERVQTQLQAESLGEGTPVPDRQRTRADALRALEHPEQVLSELLEEPARMEHRESDRLTQTLLAQADEGTRKILEAALLYEKNPQAAMESGLIKPASASALNAEVLQVEEQRSVERILRTQETDREETELFRETLERVVERSAGGAAAAPRRTGTERRPSVSIVHRQSGPEPSEDYLTAFQQQHTTQVSRTEEVHAVSNREVLESQLSDVRQELTAKSTEDITEIVNRTLARQMGTISEKVYSQMEKRLQTERARRGRF